MAGQKSRVRHVYQAIPLHSRSWKLKRLPGLTADGGVHRQRDSHIHRIAHRIADDGVRAMDTPTEALAPGSGKDLILLRIVKVFNIEPRLLFSKRRGRHRAFAISLEWS